MHQPPSSRFPVLHVVRSAADTPSPLPPILLLHGFGSSSEANWDVTGWVRYLSGAGRDVIMVDLPAHGRSGIPDDDADLAPSRVRATLLRILVDEGITPLDGSRPDSGVDVLGYSLGARLAWEFGADHPDLVRRMVLGGPGSGDPLAAFDLEAAERQLAGGPDTQDPATADLLRMTTALPGNDLTALLSMVRMIRTEPFDPRTAVPVMPLLLVAGDEDPYTAGIEDLGTWAPRARIVLLPRRNHRNAVTSRQFKDAAAAFLAENG